MKIKSIEIGELEFDEFYDTCLIIQTTNGRVFNIPIGEFEIKDEENDDGDEFGGWGL